MSVPEPRVPAALVVGCGLIGTSIGLALRSAGWVVELSDRSSAAMTVAAGLGAGRAGKPWPPPVAASVERVEAGVIHFDVAVVAVPPGAVPEVCQDVRARRLAAVVMHVCSIQTQPRLELRTKQGEPPVIGTHPMAGRETSGPTGAAGSLFADRPWVVCRDGSHPIPSVVDAVIEACAAHRVDMTAEEHDAAVALVSHLPQLVSSLLAGRLLDATAGALAVAGTGIRDMTRLAGGEPSMWTDIIVGNAPAVRRELAAFVAAAGELTAELDAPDPAPTLRRTLGYGREGRSRLGGKHGAASQRWTAVQVVIADTPGALVDVLTVCRDVAVNVEDLTVEHALGHPSGVLELLVDPQRAPVLVAALGEQGWPVAQVAHPHD